MPFIVYSLGALLAQSRNAFTLDAWRWESGHGVVPAIAPWPLARILTEHKHQNRAKLHPHCALLNYGWCIYFPNFD